MSMVGLNRRWQGKQLKVRRLGAGLPVLRFLILISWLPLAAFAQTQTAPAWPDIKFSTCPKIVAPRLTSELSWKYGEGERGDLAAISQSKSQKEAVELLVAFAEKYPDSDYRETALLLAFSANATLKDLDGQLRLAKALIDLPTAQASTRVLGYVFLDDKLSRYALPTDPDKERKVRDLEMWTRCGIEAANAEIKPANMSTVAFEENRQLFESVLFMTQGHVAFLRDDYKTALPKLERAVGLNPKNALANLWLGDAKLVSPSPDFNGGIFYLARWVELAPEVAGAPNFLKQMYVIVHGSDKGIENLSAIAKANTTPPPGFSVLAPPKKGHHYGAAVVATAIVGLLVYGAVKCPECFASGGNVPSSTPVQKTMIFGGPGHRTYLGCLRCSEDAPDSVSNETGRNGRRDSNVSIWNHFGQYGSPDSNFSACNPDATDPPVIVDQNGNAYGRVTVNQYATGIGTGEQLRDWLVSAVCAN
jgi:tetratricopeptide (TPR) repeat protein